MTDNITLLIVDDQRLMREGLRTLLELEHGFEIVGEAANGQDAIDAYAQLNPDVVLMDIRMPGMDGVEATRRLCTSWPGARVIILTTFDDDANVFEGLRAGAVGYLLKDLSGQELANAVRTVYKGGALIEPTVAKRVMAEFARLHPPARSIDQGLAEPLSERELDVLKLVSAGTQQSRDRQQAGFIRRHSEKLCYQCPAKDRRARSHPGCVARPGIRVNIGRRIFIAYPPPPTSAPHPCLARSSRSGPCAAASNCLAYQPGSDFRAQTNPCGE
jgi:DNA-binding NarL/FixJ family response regulator